MRAVYEEGAPTDSDTQGNVYQEIINKVISTSHNDFEEFGVDNTTLEELRQVSDSLALAQPTLLPFIVASSQSRSFLPSHSHISFVFSVLVSHRCRCG